MFAWQETSSPVLWPANGIALEPVCTATRPEASRTATWRPAEPGSSATSRSRASPADAPDRIRSSAYGPYEGWTLAWVATAPTPGSAHGTIGPTENQCDWTATPSSPVAGSRATIEYVCTGRKGTSWLSEATPETAGFETTSVISTRATTSARIIQHLTKKQTDRTTCYGRSKTKA